MNKNQENVHFYLARRIVNDLVEFGPYANNNSDKIHRFGILSESFLSQGEAPSEINDAHACGKVGVALQAARTRRGGSLCEP